MQQTMTWSWWRSWRQAIAFGMPLALIEIGFIAVVLTHTEIFPTYFFLYVVLPLAMLPYLVIPFIAGYRFYQLRHDSTKCGWAGLRVGMVSFALVILFMAAVTGIYYAVSPPMPPPTRGSGGLLVVGLAVVYGIPIEFNGTGMLLAGIFGQAAGVIAEWRAPVATQTHKQEPQS